MSYLTRASLFLFDPLSLFFLCVILIVSLPSAVYSVGYLKNSVSRAKLAWAWLLFILFVISMCVVVSAANVLLFLVAWEIMSLVSYFLVVFETNHDRAIQAGTIYIAMTHIGTAFLVAAFMLLFNHARSFDLLAIKDSCASMPGQLKTIVFILLLIGFGTKAGITPLHIWLPYAHPQAPSHISSVMSGVMIKTALYGLIRFILYVLGIQAAWWGIALITLAVITCFTGIIYALVDRDIKRLLAYSSVENIGVMLLGIGLSVFFKAKHLEYLAVFSLIAGLYHLINHAVFKGLLFLCAGSIYKATGTRDIEKLGGLIKKMPLVAVSFLIGAMAISSLPPLNGFVSEWLTLQAFFLGAGKVGGTDKLFLGAGAAALALTSGLAAACFVRAFGMTFLAQPRSRYAHEPKPTPLSMNIGMLFLVIPVILLGLAPAAMIRQLAKVSGATLGISIEGMHFGLNNLFLNPQPGAGAGVSTQILALAIFMLAAASIMVYRLAGKKRVVVNKTWDCGYYALSPRNEYTATGFSKPFRIAFSFFLLPYRKTEKIRESFYHVRSFAYETYTTPVFKKYIYKPVLGLVLAAAKAMRRIQPGSIHLYLSYILAATLVLIMLMRHFS